MGMVMDKIAEDGVMRDIFWERMLPEIEEYASKRVQQQVQQHDRANLFDYVQKGGMTLDFAASEAGLTTEQFRQQMEEYQKNNLQPV